MPLCEARYSAPGPTDAEGSSPLIVIGVTHPQTCLVLAERLRAFRNAGFRVVLISSPGPLLDRIASEEHIEVCAIRIRRHIAPLQDVVSLIRLCAVLRRLRPSLAEFSTPKAGLLGSFAALLSGVPVRVYMLRGLRLETLVGVKRWISLRAERVAAACAHRVVCNSESLRDKALALRIAPTEKLHLIGKGSSNGVDVDRFSPGPPHLRKSLGFPRRAPIVGFVGRLTHDKGIPELIEAFDQIWKAVPDARLLLVGWFDRSDDAIGGELRKRIDGDPRITRTGFVTDASPYYRVMDVLVLPTRREGFPNVILEAAASGVPVVTTFSTGSRDAVLPEVTGLLIPPGYPEAIAEAILRLLRNPQERRRMGRAARAWVVDQFLTRNVLGLTVDYYNSLLDSAAQSADAPILTRAAAGD